MLGVVGDENDHACRLVLPQAGGGESEVARLAVAADPGLLLIAHRAVADRLFQAFDDAAVIGVGDRLRVAGERSAFDSQHLLGGGVVQGDVQIGIERDDGDRRGREHGAQVIQRSAQLGGGGTALAALGGGGQRMLYGRRQALEAVLHQVIVGAGLHGRHRGVLADGARDDQERRIGLEFTQNPQRSRRGKAGQIVIRDHRVPGAAGQSLAHARFVFNANRGMRQPGGAQRELQQLEIAVGILDTQDAHGRTAGDRGGRDRRQGLEAVGNAQAIARHAVKRARVANLAADGSRKCDCRHGRHLRRISGDNTSMFIACGQAKARIILGVARTGPACGFAGDRVSVFAGVTWQSARARGYTGPTNFSGKA